MTHRTFSHDDLQDHPGHRRRGLRGGSMAPRAVALAGAGAGLGLLAWRRMRSRGLASLEGRVAVVTGGSRGLGLLLARELGRQGARVAICARDAEELERATNDLRSRGVEVLARSCDIGVQADVERFLGEVLRELGPVDVLVNNAGVMVVGPLRSMEVEDFRRAMDTMFWGTLYPTLAVLPSMRRRGWGRIANITSIGGKMSVPHLMPYSAAKFAAVGFSEGLRAELAGTGVRVTTVVPGLMRTGSYLNAEYRGEPGTEVSWFSPLSALPGISTNAEGTARKVVEALRRGDADHVVTLPARLAMWMHGLFPGATAEVNGLVSRLVRASERGDGRGSRDEAPVTGWEATAQARLPLIKPLTTMGRAAAWRLNQFPGPSPLPSDTASSARDARGTSMPGAAPPRAEAEGDDRAEGMRSAWGLATAAADGRDSEDR